MTNTRIGFVGLGVMGHAMASHLLEAPGEMAVYDVRSEAMTSLVEAGAIACSSAKEVADIAETVFVSLPLPTVVTDVVCGPEGLLEGSAIRNFVDLSTTGTAVAGIVAEALAPRGIHYLDAPVSGGPQGAINARLTVMAAGADELFAELEPLLKLIGTNVIHVGETPGQGQLTKLLNNLMSATAMAITGEAVALGVKGGLDPARLLAAINLSSGRNTASEDKYPRCVLTRKFDFGFRTRLMSKDVALCMEEAARLKTPMVLGSSVRQLWAVADANASDTDDFTTIAKMLEGWAGVTIGDHEGS